MTDLVSVIVPCYNQGKFLHDTLLSVAKQTHQNFECIIVNDGSTDNTEEIATEYATKDKRFIYVLKENGGLSSARNAGLRKATGEYMQFLDSDDILEKDKLRTQVDFLKRNDNVDIVYGSSRYFKTTDPEKLYSLGVGGMSPLIEMDAKDTCQFYSLLYKNVSTICSTLYQKRVFEKVPFFDEELKAFEDWFFHINCSIQGLKFHYSKAESSRSLIRVHNESMMRQDGFMQENRSLFTKKVKHLIEQNPREMPWQIPTVYKDKAPAKPLSPLSKLKKVVKNFVANS